MINSLAHPNTRALHLVLLCSTMTAPIGHEHRKTQELEENYWKTGEKLEETECISFVSFNGNPGKNEGLNFEEHEGHH